MPTVGELTLEKQFALSVRLNGFVTEPHFIAFGTMTSFLSFIKVEFAERNNTLDAF